VDPDFWTGIRNSVTFVVGSAVIGQFGLGLPSHSSSTTPSTGAGGSEPSLRAVLLCRGQPDLILRGIYIISSFCAGC